MADIEELLQRAQRVHQRLHAMQITGLGWSGDARKGFIFNPIDTGGACFGSEGPPTEFTGACCIGESCSILSAADCADAGGEYQGDFTVCFPNPCLNTGACCVDEDCSVQTESDCVDMGGDYQGDGTDCDDPDTCIICVPPDSLLHFDVSLDWNHVVDCDTYVLSWTSNFSGGFDVGQIDTCFFRLQQSV